MGLDELLKKARQPAWVETAKENLCYRGRILRGMDLAAKTDDLVLRAQIKNAIVAMEDELDQLEKQILQLGGGAVAPCTCRYCTRNRDVLFLAESKLRRAVFELTEPAMDGLPDTLTAYQDGKPDVIKTLAERMAAAQHNYYIVCQMFNHMPEWGRILKAW